MSSLRSIADSLLATWDALKGERTVSVVDVPQDPQEGFRVVMNHGAEIEIYCREKAYRVTYSAWWVPAKVHTLYHVYCSYSAHTPRALRDKLNEEFTIGALLSRCHSRAAQKKAVIDCYVQLMLVHFRHQAR